MYGDGTVGYRGDDLAKGFRPDVADGIDAWDAGFRAFTGCDIAVIVERELAVDEFSGGVSADAATQAVAGGGGRCAGGGILQADAGQVLVMKQLRDGAVPPELNIGRMHELVMIDFLST